MGSMQKRLISASFLLTSLFVFSVEATEWDRGLVNMQGAINETPCDIDTSDRLQTIEMRTVPVSLIYRDGQDSEKKEFDIRLINCNLKKYINAQGQAQYFQVAFDGSRDAGFFGVNGDAKGIALKISDDRGNVAYPGVAMPAHEIKENEMMLHYSLRLVSNHQALNAGYYSAVIRFNVNYH